MRLKQKRLDIGIDAAACIFHGYAHHVLAALEFIRDAEDHATNITFGDGSK